jgi:methionyl-tRNA formyltransferase
MSIIYFSSGDFGVKTLQFLVNSNVNVKAVVTSKGKNKYSDISIKEVANANDIPCYIPNSEDELYKFLKGFTDIDMYVVISYKKLSNRILDLVNWVAINIHASILPFLRGAAPINWAIRNGFKETGLTAFMLSEKIDCGKVLRTITTKIDDNETYLSLFNKLSYLCPDFTLQTIKDFESGRCHLFEQVNIGVDKYKELFNAPKINPKYWGDWLCLSMNEIDCLFRSTDEGLPIKLYAVNRDDHREYYEFDCKIWDFDFIPNFEEGSDGVNWDLTECDGKNYIRVVFGTQVEKVISIKEIQLLGKKRMKIKDFLNGFKYSKLINQYKLVVSTADYGKE